MSSYRKILMNILLFEKLLCFAQLIRQKLLQFQIMTQIKK